MKTNDRATCTNNSKQLQRQLYYKAMKYIKHTHCLHLAKAIQGGQCAVVNLHT